MLFAKNSPSTNLPVEGEQSEKRDRILLKILLVVICLNAADYLSDDLANGCCDTQLLAVLGDLAVENVNFGLTLIKQHILSHRGVVIGDAGNDVIVVVGDELVGIQRNALCGCNGAGLADNAVESH